MIDIKEELTARTNELNLCKGKTLHLERQLMKFKGDKENLGNSFARKEEEDPDKTKKMNQ